MAKKFSPAHSSGMRGGEKPSVSGDEADTLARAAETTQGESTEDGDFDMNDHVHGPDENGHRHLNLTTMADAMHKKSGLHDE